MAGALPRASEKVAARVVATVQVKAMNFLNEYNKGQGLCFAAQAGMPKGSIACSIRFAALQLWLSAIVKKKLPLVFEILALSAMRPSDWESQARVFLRILG